MDASVQEDGFFGMIALVVNHSINAPVSYSVSKYDSPVMACVKLDEDGYPAGDVIGVTGSRKCRKYVTHCIKDYVTLRRKKFSTMQSIN